jgi:hypothetical protein
MICSKNKSFNIKKLHVFSWLLMTALAASLPISAQAAGCRGMGGGLRFSGGPSFAFQDGGSLGLGSSFHFAILIPIIGPGPYLDW